MERMSKESSTLSWSAMSLVNCIEESGSEKHREKDGESVTYWSKETSLSGKPMANEKEVMKVVRRRELEATQGQFPAQEGKMKRKRGAP